MGSGGSIWPLCLCKRLWVTAARNLSNSKYTTNKVTKWLNRKWSSCTRIHYSMGHQPEVTKEEKILQLKCLMSGCQRRQHVLNRHCETTQTKKNKTPTISSLSTQMSHSKNSASKDSSKNTIISIKPDVKPNDAGKVDDDGLFVSTSKMSRKSFDFLSVK